MVDWLSAENIRKLRPYTEAHAGLKSGGMAKGYAKGGGIEVKGKTKGTMVKMARGGKAC